MTTTRMLLIALIAWSLCTGMAGVAQTAGMAPFGTGKAAYEREKQTIETALKDAGKAASAGYLKDLQLVLQHMEKTGDDFGIRPAKAEIKRFEQSGTVPKTSDVGTPELIQKARVRYFEALSRADAEAAAKQQALTTRYVKYLTSLKEQSQAASKPAEAAQAAAELERILSGAGAGAPAGAAAGVPPKVKGVALPKELCQQLRLLYTFEGGAGQQVMDESGWRQHGNLTGAAKGKDAREGGICTFSDSYDMLDTKEIRISTYWTVSVRARFPLESKKDLRVLVSSAHGKHHVGVDATGMLGMHPKDFAGCGYNVNSLSGWHDITVVSSWRGNFFFVDGKMVGEAKTGGPFSEPVKAIGNSAAGGSPWCGTVASVMLWTRCLSSEEVAELCKLRSGT